MHQTDFTTALQEADRGLREAGIPPAVAARLQRRLFAWTSPGRRRVAYGLAFAAAAACVAALLVMRRTPSPPATEPARIGWLELGQASHDLVTRVDVQRGTVTIERGSCTLTDRQLHMALESGGPLQLLRQPDGLRVIRGRVDVRVEPRPGPLRVLVSHHRPG
jgi:transmembrane sensor